MKVWLINHYAVPPSLYPLARTSDFARYLMQAGHTVTIFAASMVHNAGINLIEDRSSYREDTCNGIHYVYVRTCFYRGNGIDRIRNMIQFAVRLPRVCGNFEKPDVILASSATPVACMAGLKLAQRYGCRGVAEVSDLWPESFVSYGLLNSQNPILIPLYRYERIMYQRADALIFTMEGGAEYLIDKGWDKKSGGRIDLKHVYHINNGVDLEAFDYNCEHFIVEDSDLDNPDTFKVVYAGSIREVNSLGTLVEAAEILQKKADNRIQFLLYGDGYDRQVLAGKCIQKGLYNIVFKGRVDKKYIPGILSRADLNLLHVRATPIVRYGLSLNKLFEYFAAAKPILSDVESNYDLIKRYHAGIVMASQTPEAVARAIWQLSVTPLTSLQAMAENARKAAQNYDFYKLTQNLITILDGC